jgi:hypothetical protein
VKRPKTYEATGKQYGRECGVSHEERKKKKIRIEREMRDYFSISTEERRDMSDFYE